MRALNVEAFRYASLVSGILCAVTPLFLYVEWMNSFLLVWGAVLIVWDIFTTHHIFKNKAKLVLILFMICYFISVIVNWGNFPENDYGNIVMMCYCALSYFVSYSYDTRDSEKKVMRQVKVMNAIFIIMGSVLALANMILFATHKTYPYTTLAGNPAVYGMLGNRFYGFLGNPNIDGIFAAMVIAFTIVCLYLKLFKSKTAKVLSILAIILNYIALCVSVSRGSELAIVVFVGALLLFSLEKFFSKVGVKRILAFLCSLVIGLISALGLYMSFDCGRLVINAVVIKTQPPAQVLPGQTPVVPIDPSLIERGDEQEFTNGRMRLWKAGLHVIKQKPLFGTSFKNIAEDTLKYYEGDSTLPGLEGAGMHNQFMQVAVANGLIGLALFIVITLIFVYTILRYILKRHRPAHYKVMVAFLAVFCMFFANNLVESRIVYGNYYGNVMFWSYLAFAMYFIRKDTGTEDKENFLSRLFTFPKGKKRALQAADTPADPEEN